MNWNREELVRGAEIANRIAEHAAPRSLASPASAHPCLSSADASEFVKGLHWSSNGLLSEGAVAVRQICRGMAFDEHLPFRWRLEHKLVQAHVLNYFCPGSIPVTWGLRRHLSNIPAEMYADRVRQVLSEQNVVKAALGYGAPPDSVGEVDRVVRAIASDSGRAVECLADEDWVIQERIPIVEEYRVHSIEDRAVEDLTFSRHSGRPVKAQRGGSTSYVQSLLDRLPNACVANLVCGWDIADTGDGGFRVIEMNIGGFHPVYQASYQVSGFFQDRSWGPVVVARLIRFIETRYGVQVQFRYGDDPCNLQGWYRSVEQWAEIFRISGRIHRLATEVDGQAGEKGRTEERAVHVHGTLVRILKRLKNTVDLVD